MKNATIRNKGKSLLDFPDEYCVIDIETTGLDPQFDSIIEVSALKISYGNICDKFSSLIKPDEYYIFDEEDFEDESLEFLNDLIDYDGEKIYYIDDFIKNLTGITNHMLSEAPSCAMVLEQLKDFIGDSILVGHNVNFDINFLYDNFKTLGHVFNNNFVDTLRLSRRLLPDLKNHKLQTLSEHFGVNYSGAHRALADCEITHSCFSYLKEIAIQNYGAIDNFYESIKRALHSQLDLTQITAQTDIFDTTHLLYGKECVFTGTLSKMSRKDAAQLVVNKGGTCGNSITKKTNFLILGITDYKKTKGKKSSKQRKAEELKLKGYDIEVLTETVFYDLISEE